MSKGKDEFGDRMKNYEAVEAGRRFIPLLPVVARLDGKSFSKWTKGFKRPYDQRMSDLMVHTTQVLVQETQALIGYTQSDEITLAWYSPDYKSQIFFDGRIMKMTSVLASMATGYFNALVPSLIPERENHLAFFDCRVWQLPNLVEAVNTILWRELDATKNSVSMAARNYYSHNQLHELGRAEMMDLLMVLEPPINWNNYPAFFKRGVYVQRRRVMKKFTEKEKQFLPPQHEAHTNPDLVVERSETRQIELPPLSKVLNRVEVIFEGADPITEAGWEDVNTSE